MCGEYINVYMLDVPYHADLEYTYYVPVGMRAEIERGTAVVVPFGISDRRKSAIVVCADASPSSNAGIKSVCSVLSGYFKLDEDMLSLCAFMKAQTLCTFGEAVRTV